MQIFQKPFMLQMFSQTEMISQPMAHFFFFWLRPHHVEVPPPGLEPEPPQGPKPLQGPCRVPNPLCHQGALQIAHLHLAVHKYGCSHKSAPERKAFCVVSVL